VRALLPEPSGPLDDAAVADHYAYPDDDPERGWLRANMVSSLDGAAVVDGSSRPLSSPGDQSLLGLLRALADVVVVGAQTVRVEAYGPTRPRPSMVERRRAQGRAAAPLLAVVSSTLDLDPSAELFTQAVVRPVVLTHAGAPSERRRLLAEVADVVDCGDERVDLGRALQELHRRGLRRQLTEGGPHLLGQLVADDLVDELTLSLAPALAGAGAMRVTAGEAPGHEGVRGMRLAGLLEADSTLFARYVRERQEPT